MAASDLPRLLHQLEHWLGTQAASTGKIDGERLQLAASTTHILAVLEKAGSVGAQSAAVR